MIARSRRRGEDREAAFKEIYDIFWAPVQRHIECVVEDDYEVAEIVSDVFLLAWRKLDAARPLGLIWLIRTADNRLKDRERRQWAESRAMGALLAGYAVENHDDVLESLAVRHAMNKVLTQKERRIVMLSYWDQLAAGEIADLLRCSQANVWTSLSRARKKLEAELGLDETLESGSMSQAKV